MRLVVDTSSCPTCAATYSWSAPAANSDAMQVYRRVCGVTSSRIAGSPALARRTLASSRAGGITCCAIALRVQRLPRALMNAGAPGRQVVPRAALYAPMFLLKVVVDVDATYSRRRLGIEYADLPAREVHVLALEIAQLAHAQPRERQGGDDGAVARHGAIADALGMVDGR